MIEPGSFQRLQHAMIDNTTSRDEKLQPPFMHTALDITLDLNYRLKTSPKIVATKDHGRVRIVDATYHPIYLQGYLACAEFMT